MTAMGGVNEQEGHGNMELDKAAMQRPKLVIFDCDGVLVDSEPISNRIMAEAITEAGVPVNAEEVAQAFEGMRLEDIQGEVETRLGGKLPAKWLTDFEAKRAVAFRADLDAIPGVAEALTRIRATDIAMCVASQASREKIELTLGLTDLMPHFRVDALFSSRMVEYGKPHPDLFLLAASSMGFDPADCVVVEDGTLGARGGRLAGMRTLGYAPRGDGDRLAREGAVTFTSMTELPVLLGLIEP
jgi:HAD superfamily hydrolase (TIGR01509 family)